MRLPVLGILGSCILLVFYTHLAANAVLAQTSQGPKPTISRESGGSIQTPLGYGITVNKESTLTREWVTFHDPALPADVAGTVGIKTVYESERGSGDYKYSTRLNIEAREPVAAIEVRFLLFDIWGNHIKTLSLTQVADISDKKELTAEWRAFSENEVSEYYASIAFIARVRTQSGRVVEANTSLILEEARKFSRKFSVESLEPKTAKP
jgi:hypothetical protein